MNDKEELKVLAEALEELQSEIAKPKPSKGRFCPSCGEGKIEPIKGTEPYSEDHLMCNKCDSTFNKEHMKEMCKSRVDLQKKHMKLYELQHHVDKLIEQEYSDTPVYFDTEAKSYDYHIVPIGSINLVPKEAMGEDYIILNEYQYAEKPEEPLIVHNVMSYKGKNYLAQKAEAMRCTKCKMDGVLEDVDCSKHFQCLSNCYWESFDDIHITDELACMRKDIGDIYLIITDNDTPIIDKFYGITAYNAVLVSSKDTYKEYVRLATAEEIQKYLEEK